MNKEQKLIQQAKAFDMETLSFIYDEYSPGLYRYAIRQLGDEHQAEDCVAETFDRFLTALKHGKGPRQYLRAYLYRIAHNWITDQYRRKGPPEIPLEDELAGDQKENPESQVAALLMGEKLRGMLAFLTPEQRQVISLKFLEGWSVKEISEALEKPVGAVKSLQHRGLNALKRMWEEKETVQ